jgi:hypothetical protein
MMTVPLHRVVSVTASTPSISIFSFFLVSWGRVRLGPLGTSATNWPIVPAPDDRWWVWSSRWNENCHRKPRYSEKTCLSATLSTTNPTWPALDSNPGRRCGKPATNRLSYSTTSSPSLWNNHFVQIMKSSLRLAWEWWRKLIMTMPGRHSVSLCCGRYIDSG